MHKLLSFSKPSPPKWVASLCGVTGAGLLLAGLVCFFAYNWADLGLWMKFGLPLLGLLACAWGAQVKGLSGGAGQVCSFACGVFIGVFWAVYGQVFQTGAFAYEFFLVWGLCLLPLVVLAGNRWLWLLWAALVCGYVDKEGFNARTTEMLIAGINLLFFAAFEAVYFKTKRMGWFSVFFLIPALGVCVGWICSRWFHMWFFTGLLLTLGLAVYACKARRGAVQLGLCALALDVGILCRLWDFRGIGLWLPFAALALTALSAWAVYMLTRKEDTYD